MTETKFIYLFTSCYIFNGSKNSIICDPERNQYFQIPKDFASFCESLYGTTILQLQELYGQESEEIINTYLDFLYSNELIFYSSLPAQYFPKIKNDFITSPGITNIIWDDISNYSVEEIQETYSKNKKHFSGYLEIRMYSQISLFKLTEIIKIFESNSSLVGISITLPYSNEKLRNELLKLFEKFPRLWTVVLFGALEENVIIFDGNFKKNLTLTTKMINSSLCCGNVRSELFSNTTQHIRESLSYNSCLNRKISLDSNGNIKNCPSMSKSFGNIQDTTFEEALSKPEFKKYWNINKDKIEVCKDCEFRHICTDCRAYLEDPSEKYSKPIKCGYNPYTGEWSEWSTNPLKQKAIGFYGMKEILET